MLWNGILREWKDKRGLDFAVIEMSGDGNLWNGD